MTAGDDGGRRALAGFLYQLLGVAGLVAKAWRADPPGPAGELGILLELVRHGVVEQEADGQDAKVTGLGWDGKHARKLVQFKYSSRPQDHDIQPKELLAIVKAFQTSERSANRSERLSTGFVLVSNRNLSSGSDTCMRAARDRKGHRSLGKLSGKRAARRVLQSLHFLRESERHWIDEISNLGKQLALTDHELDEGIKKLISYLFSDAASGHSSFTGEKLASVLADFPSPRMITREGLEERMIAELSDFKTAMKIPSRTLRRAVVEELKGVNEHSLFMLCGEGGCGKSTTLCHVLEDLLHADSSVAKCYAVGGFGRELPPYWVSETVGKWRNSPSHPYHSEPQNAAVDRLERASGGSERPILVLAIDGLDEALAAGPDTQEPIRRILRLVWEEYRDAVQAASPPRVVLLVTCRSPNDLFGVWSFSQVRFSTAGQVLKEIPVSDFTTEELVELSGNSIPGPAAERIRQMAEQDTLASGFLEAPVDLLKPKGPRSRKTPLPVARETYAALKHPLFWRFFVSQPEEIRKGVLDGERDSLWRVCESYLDWFYEKARWRRIPAFTPDNAKAMLVAIARAFGKADSIGKRDVNWNRPATADGRFSESEARWLFQEASSFGLAKEVEAATWRWRHPFLCEYLASREEVG